VKNILISGASRSGKTMLAKRINAELGHSIVNVDALVSAFECAFPQLGIKHSENDSNAEENIAPFLVSYLHDAAYCSKGAPFVFEGSYFKYERVIPEIDPDEYLFIGLAYNRLSVKEIFDNLRRYDGEYDWTFGMNDAELLGNAEYFHNDTRYHQEKMERHGFKIYDVSYDRESVFDKIINDIREELGWTGKT
jgi:hypothetical protein